MAKYFTYKTKEISVGDTIRVALNVVEGEKTRQQMFEGVVISVDNRGAGKSICVRKIAAGGIGVERILPLESPIIADISLITQGDVRRSKLYYLRGRVGKQALKIKKKAIAAKTA